MQFGNISVDHNLIEKINFWSNPNINHSKMAQILGPEIRITPSEKKVMKLIKKYNIISDENNNHIPLTQLKNKVTILLKSEASNYSNVQIAFWHQEKIAPTAKKISIYFESLFNKIIHYFSGYNSCHVDMNVLKKENRYLVGWGFNGRVIDDDYAKTSRCVELFDLNITKLFGFETNKEAKDKFSNNLNRFIRSVKSMNTVIPDSPITRIRNYFNPIGKQKVELNKLLEDEYKINEYDANFCSAVPVTLIVLAHLKTCKELELKIPEDLSHYGLHPNENMANITPERLNQTLIAKGIFEAHFGPFRYID